MTNLPMMITHSLRFLGSYLRDSDKLEEDIRQRYNRIDDTRSDDPGYSGQMRLKSKKFTEDFEKDLDATETDFQIYFAEMSEITSNKNDEVVIFQLTNYERYLLKYEDVLKKYKKITVDIKRDYRSATVDNDFIKAIALKHVLTAQGKLESRLERIISSLEHITKKRSK